MDYKNITTWEFDTIDDLITILQKAKEEGYKKASLEYELEIDRSIYVSIDLIKEDKYEL